MGHLGTHGASFTFINDRKSLKTFSDIAVEGKLRLKVLDLSNRWPNDLIYNEEFFDRSQDFCEEDFPRFDFSSDFMLTTPYAMQNLHILQDYDGEIKNESSSSVVFNNSNHLLGNEATSKCINNVINSNPKFNKATYSNSDLLKIFASIKTAEISNVLLEKLAALKIVSSHTYDEARDINLKMLDTIVIKDRETELTAAGIKNRSHNKRRYLRKQILAVQNILSAEDWSFYAKIRFPSLSKQELFSKSNCVEKNLCRRTLGRKSLNTPCSVDCLISKEFTSKLSCIDLQKQSVKPYKENAFKKSLVSEKSEDWKKKLIKINSKFFNEMFLKMNKYKEVAVSTEENQTVSVSIQTEEQLIRNSTNLTGDIYLIDDDMAYEDCKNKFSHEFRLMQDNIHQIEDYMTHILSSKLLSTFDQAGH
ncbi:unnamed protein product [Thelazia callipaeda]|uniref:BHLH domain-containing protein n=1 Tax=Thelazia callipaeda TaxID=103827 RepID=A0A0N5CKX8_THECL|nr:unnamed protein product [Thelazia callipaeda]